MPRMLDVAVGVLIDSRDRVLVALRRPETPGAGYWEFPGGKREPDEAIVDCLNRELAEEIGVTDIKGHPLICFSHDQGPQPVRLHVWQVTDWTGEPGGREGQKVDWVARHQLKAIDLLPASHVILAGLSLPRRYALLPTYQRDERKRWFGRVADILTQGIDMLWLNQPQLGEVVYAQLAEKVLESAHASGACLMLDRAPSLVEKLGADGLHEPAGSTQLSGQRPLPRQYWFAMTAGSHQGLENVVAREADFACLGPVARTTGPNAQRPLGWPEFERQRGDWALPVYARGGLGQADINDALMHNAQGIIETL